ncbi:hypothetical protein HPP92_027590 [Vanilla planifolia]|uniref:BHLH domain-containing protein n=1 Tax=Vanilla planifolia TaxID=51239 RepID=A0A835PB82_VANPL|nr:hypothetical protein HPP92_027590 [Vanilla planifolia]
MNHNLPHWNMEEYSKTFRSILSSTNQKKPTGLQQEELTDLTRKNENVMMLSSQRKSSSSDVKEDQKAAGNSNNSLMEEEIASWFMYPPYELLDKDFQSDFLYEIPNPQPTITEKPNRSLGTEGLNCTHPNSSPQQNRASPRDLTFLSQHNNTYSDHGSIVNFPHFSRSSASNCRKSSFRERMGDYESADGKKLAQRSQEAVPLKFTIYRNGRDRINEKMKALQDLIPHCTKSDKASMLDETIEYLKSLQQQVQMMWMGSGMVPMVFQASSIPSPQAMNLYAYGSQMTQQNQMAAAISNSLPTYGYSPETTRQRPG